MTAPQIPKLLIVLGRLVEIDTIDHTYGWIKKDNFVLCTNEDGTKLFAFKNKSKKSTQLSDNENYKRAKRLYRNFNSYEAKSLKKETINNLKQQESRCIYVIYSSDKEGKRQNYIHTFKKRPVVWVDRLNNPNIIALVGGNIRVTTRGILG